ncbi:hypothetical protein TNCV_969871 [Trichonephila clavipes]|nr:hypothetical protein TNCV_969871 [Trichonephila clavipes]
MIFSTILQNADIVINFDVAENKSSSRLVCQQLASIVVLVIFMTSNTVSDGYEVNLRLVYGMRCIGIKVHRNEYLPPPAKFERLYTPILKRWKLFHLLMKMNKILTHFEEWRLTATSPIMEK